MKLAVVILAAGRGERMNSALPKVLHKISGKAMLQHVIDAASGLKPSRIIVVAGRHYKEIKDALKDSNILFAIQKEPKGTGDAVLKARTFLEGFKGDVLILNGDAPLVTAQALIKFLGLHRKNNNDISLVSFVAANPEAYGRIVRDESGGILSIAEERDATDAQKKITEVNSGIYAVKAGRLGLLKEIRLNTLKNEYYLTDIIGIAKGKGCKAEAYCIGSEDELMGINTRPELLKAQQAYRKRLINNWMEKDITFFDSDSVFIYPEVMIGKGTTIYPDVFLEGKTKIGRGCAIYPNVRIIDSVVKDGAVIKDSTVIEGSVIMAGAVVGPFAHIRPGSEIGAGAKIGNFVEVKKSTIGRRTKASHLSYLGDASIGNDVNIGAGTITCNYDGKEKHGTTIEDRVFVGSDTQFIAPVRVGRGAYIGAGSTITKSVPPKALAVSRVEQKNIKDWAVKRQLRVKSGKLKVKGVKKEM